MQDLYALQAYSAQYIARCLAEAARDRLADEASERARGSAEPGARSHGAAARLYAAALRAFTLPTWASTILMYR